MQITPGLRKDGRREFECLSLQHGNLHSLSDPPWSKIRHTAADIQPAAKAAPCPEDALIPRPYAQLWLAPLTRCHIDTVPGPKLCLCVFNADGKQPTDDPVQMREP